MKVAYGRYLVGLLVKVFLQQVVHFITTLTTASSSHARAYISVVQPFQPQADMHCGVAACGGLRNHYVRVLRQRHYSAWRLTVLRATPPRSADRTSAVMCPPDTRRVLSREQAIQVYDRSAQCVSLSTAGEAMASIPQLRTFLQSRSCHQGQQQCVWR